MCKAGVLTGPVRGLRLSLPYDNVGEVSIDAIGSASFSAEKLIEALNLLAEKSYDPGPDPS